MLPEDLLKYGLIPEFVGRLPVITSVDNLDEDALMDILTKPKNALVQAVLQVLRVRRGGARVQGRGAPRHRRQAILRGTGARGLRAIMEEVFLGVMYELPCPEDVAKCVVDKEAVLTGVNPTLVPHTAPKRAKREERSA